MSSKLIGVRDTPLQIILPMLSVITHFAILIALGLIFVWAVKRAIVYRRAIKLIPLPGYRNLGPQCSALYGLVHVKMMQTVEDGHILAKNHLDYERFGWDVISSIHWFASKPRFFIADASIIQHIASSRNRFTKPTEIFELSNMFGYNVATVEGAEWVRHRKVTSRALSEPNMKMVWKQTTRIVNEMFDLDWAHQGDQFALDDVMHTTTKLSMLVIITAGFGQDDKWIHNSTPPPSHLLTFRQASKDVVDNLILRFSLPSWVWGSRADRDALAIAGIAGRGWLGKQAWRTAVAFSELRKYMREMLQDELTNDPNHTPGREYGNLYSTSNLIQG
ncbi:hypothetical protein FRB93_004701 [Tulasnella sp. JGI-2019a]|nr:hypothetical protein FRB93_004701 [Tulasnella sp. JGI-2019a]